MKMKTSTEKQHPIATGKTAFGYMALPGWKAGWAATGLENGAAGCKKMVEVSLNF